MSDLQPRLDFDAGDPAEHRDEDARRLAVDPTRNVALEASAGTGKTRVLVDRYVGLLLADVKPRNILAMTFTRKAAAEMRQRILQELARRRLAGSVSPALWRELRESLTDITISTIDAFCLALLHEFPLEADVDPGFDLADETETPRLVDEALDRALRIGRSLIPDEPEIALLFADLGEFQLREGLARLIDRRLVAWDALDRFLRGPSHSTIDDAVRRLVGTIRAGISSVPGGLDGFLASAPAAPDVTMMSADLRRVLGDPAPSGPATQAWLERVRDHVLTQDGSPRKRLKHRKDQFRSARDYERHLAAVGMVGPHLAAALHAYRDDINRLLARAVRRLFALALDQYQRTLQKHGVLDFSDVLQRTLGLLGQMDEFSRSRFKLEARYQHVLVDEFQDTSRAQWDLVERLVRSWASGWGMHDRGLLPSIFIVGDRKQAIYGFRDAEVAVLDEAARYIEALRPDGPVRTAITRSFRSVRELLAFVNDVFTAIDKAPERSDAFRYAEDDRFPLASVDVTDPDALGIAAAASDEAQAAIVADEIARLLEAGTTVRDRDTGVRRAAKPGDIAVLFRTRDGHRVFEDPLTRRGVPFYVYKGLGFFDADEIKDVVALLAFLARPESELNAAAFLRSGFAKLSDEALKHLAPHLSAAMTSPDPPAALTTIRPHDERRLTLLRASIPRWLHLVDRLPPAEVLDLVMNESAYAAEVGGPSSRQARENLKKIRGLVRRVQNRGYATMSRVVDHLTALVTGGDESNAIVDAIDAVNLMTTHAAKGLEFPIVFVVNMHRGSGGAPDPIRIVPAPFGRADTHEPSVAIGEHLCAADADVDAREAEEGKRLLYVALTRARDRLYLSGTLTREGRFAPGKGGLGRTLPVSLTTAFVEAAAGKAVVDWAGATGAHRLRVLHPAPAPIVLSAVAATQLRLDLFDALRPDGVPRVAVTHHDTERVGPVTRPTPAMPSETIASDSAPSPVEREVGAIVHRVLEGAGLGPVTLDDAIARIERGLADHEHAAIENVDAVVEHAAGFLLQLQAHPEWQAIAGPGTNVVWRRHEVPFSLWRGDRVVRGRIDCLLQRDTGVVEVVELKTGRNDAAHREQLDLYVQAARALFPGAPVEGRLIYAREAPNAV
jgi:ATP-dependent helicase/nuclease subunit A